MPLPALASFIALCQNGSLRRPKADSDCSVQQKETGQTWERFPSCVITKQWCETKHNDGETEPIYIKISHFCIPSTSSLLMAVSHVPLFASTCSPLLTSATGQECISDYSTIQALFEDGISGNVLHARAWE